MHMDTSFCGYKVEVVVNSDTYQFHQHDHVLGEFHSQDKCSLRVGDEELPLSKVGVDFNPGKFSHLENRLPVFVISPGRKWVLRESLLDKIYLQSKALEFSVYLIQHGKVVFACTSKTFQVQLAKTVPASPPNSSPVSTPTAASRALLVTPKQAVVPFGLSVCLPPLPSSLPQRRPLPKPQPEISPSGLLGLLAEAAEKEKEEEVEPRKRRRQAATTSGPPQPPQPQQMIQIQTPFAGFTLVVTPNWLERYYAAQQRLPPPTELELNGIVYSTPEYYL
ncbi:hypothetical protein BASA81_000511 [Batrachochytrium salamandrivorans]|nr:hypothetical protein BASA81_000511 [Batrachochytrium salamandrivorans]